MQEGPGRIGEVGGGQKDGGRGGGGGGEGRECGWGLGGGGRVGGGGEGEGGGGMEVLCLHYVGMQVHACNRALQESGIRNQEDFICDHLYTYTFIQ